jgi:hypothetical protein
VVWQTFPRRICIIVNEDFELVLNSSLFYKKTREVKLAPIIGFKGRSKSPGFCRYKERREKNPGPEVSAIVGKQMKPTCLRELQEREKRNKSVIRINQHAINDLEDSSDEITDLDAETRLTPIYREIESKLPKIRNDISNKRVKKVLRIKINTNRFEN